MGTFRLTWYNPFKYRSTQNAFLGQIDQTAPSQVDQRSKLVKTIPKLHFSCFYVTFEVIGDFYQPQLN